MIKEVKRKAVLINKKSPVRILFLEEEDKRVKKAIQIIKNEKIAIPFVVKGRNIDEKIKKSKEILKNNLADAVITGATHSTLKTIYLAFEFMKKDVKRISGSFLMISKDQKKSFLFADCAVQPNPNAEQLAEITKLSAENFNFLTGKKPIIAMLSYSTKGSGKGESAENVKNACKILKQKHLKLIFDGEIQLDATFNKRIAKAKGAKSLNYNVFIFPCLDAGNIGYKLVERFGNYSAIGPILQGLNKPINDLSRGCSVKDIVDLTAITVLQVNNSKK